jgi:hypothetical protein
VSSQSTNNMSAGTALTMCLVSRNGELLFVEFQLEGAVPKASSSATTPFTAPEGSSQPSTSAVAQAPKVDLSSVQEEDGTSAPQGQGDSSRGALGDELELTSPLAS